MQKIQHDSQTKQLFRAILIGLLAGIVVSLFRLAIQHLLEFVGHSFQYFHTHPVWLIPWALGSVVLALALGIMAQRNPNIKGSGIPQVEGQLTSQFDEKWWPVLWRKFVGGILAIGSGLYLGREGPSIQLGATVGQGWRKQCTPTNWIDRLESPAVPRPGFQRPSTRRLPRRSSS